MGSFTIEFGKVLHLRVEEVGSEEEEKEKKSGKRTGTKKIRVGLCVTVRISGRKRFLERGTNRV